MFVLKLSGIQMVFTASLFVACKELSHRKPLVKFKDLKLFIYKLNELLMRK